MKTKSVSSPTLAKVAAELNAWLASSEVTVIALAYAATVKGREALVVYRDGQAPELPVAVRDWIAEQLGTRKAS